MNAIMVFAQIFGILGALSMLCSNWQKTREKMLFCLIFDGLFYFIQYILLKAYTGAFTNLISLIRAILFNKKGTNDFFRKNYILYIILLLYVIIGIFTYNGVISLLPTIATIIYTVTLWQDAANVIRYGSVMMFTMWLIYNIIVGAYASAIVEGVLLIGTIISIIKFDIMNKYKNEIKLLKGGEKSY